MYEEVASEREQQGAGARAAIGEWISRLRLIPDERRRFNVDLRQAKIEFGIDATLAQQLTAQGLPHVMVDGAPRFTATDLHYLGLRLGCATTYLGVLQTWASSLKASSAGEWGTIQVRCAPHASVNTPVAVLVGPDHRVQTTIGSDRVATSIHAVPSPHWPAVSPSLGDLLAEIASLDFCWLPESLSKDVKFTRQTGLSDCASAALLLEMECARLGIASRMAYGLLLATPFSTPHNWVEICIDDRWVPVDPLLLELLTQYTTLDASAWPRSRSPGAFLLRLAGEEAPIVLSDGGPLQATFLTTIL